MKQFFQTAIDRRVPGIALGLIVATVLTGCGIQLGYAPKEVTVHRGRGAATAPATLDSLRVVSWNIQYSQQVPLALQEIRSDPRLAGADIFLLQEMDPEASRALAEALGFYYVDGSASVHPHNKRLFGNAVLSRWPIVSDRVLVLPHTTLLTGHRRIALAAEIDLGAGRTLRAISVHTATMIMDQADRFEQARALADSLGVGADLTLIGGDFNTVSAYEATRLRQIMRRVGLGAVRLPPGPTIRNRYRKLPGSTPVLDHLFVRGLTRGAAGVARQTKASDHYPVWAVFGLENQP